MGFSKPNIQNILPPISGKDWTPGQDWEQYELAYSNGSTYQCIVAILNSTVEPESDSVHWHIYARGYQAETLSLITGTDTSGILGTPGASVNVQDFADGIGEKTIVDYVPVDNIANDQITTVSGKVADARQLNPDVPGSLGEKVKNSNDILAIRDSILTNLGCAWGTFQHGGYSIAGNLVIVNVRILTSSELVVGSTNLVTGFPLPRNVTYNYIACACSSSIAELAYIDTSGRLTFKPSVTCPVGTVLIFSTVYFK